MKMNFESNQTTHSNAISRGKRMDDKAFFTRTPLAAAISSIVLGSIALQVSALPSNPEVVAGVASVSMPAATTMQINQSSNKVVLNFEDFSIAANEAVKFVQPGTSSVALNRVSGGNPSLILGQLSANGQVFLLNESGVVFGAGSQVNVAGLVAGTMRLSDSNFLEGDYHFTADGAVGSVLNQGDITVADEGYVVLLGGDVQNTGVITANMGSVALLSGNAVDLDFSGDGLLTYSVEGGVVDALVSNKGLIQADGGLVVMAGQTAGDLMATVVNNEGVIEARGLVERDGKIILTSNATVINDGVVSTNAVSGGGGNIELHGARVGQLGAVTADGNSDGGSISITAEETIDLGATSFTTANAGVAGDGGEIITFTVGKALFRRGASIEAKGGSGSGDGGFVEVSGLQYVQVEGQVNTSAGNGITGTFLIDPTDIDITAGATTGVSNNASTFQSDGATGSSILNVTDLVNALTTNNVIVTTQTGAEALTAPKGADITVLAAITSASGNDLTLQGGEDIQIFANVDLGTGDLNLQAGVRTDIDSGSILATAKITAANVTASADTSIILTDLSTDTFSGTVNRTGPIQVTNDKTIAITADTSVGTGAVSVTTTAGSINVTSIVAGTETVTLTAAVGIDASVDNTDTEISGGTINLIANGGSIGGTNVLDIQASTAIVSEATTASMTTTAINIDGIGDTGSVSLNAEVNGDGNVLFDHEGAQTTVLNTVTAGTGNVAVTGSTIEVDTVSGTTVEITATGAIEESGGGDTAVDISATNAELIAGSGIGSTATIETDIDTLAASAAGTIDLANTGAVDINTVDATSGITTTGGDISITATGAITLTQNVIAAGAATLDANTVGSILVSAEDAGADVSGTTVTLNSAAGDVGAAAGGGAIDVTATTAVNADVTGSNGNIFVDAVDDIPLGHLNAGTGTVIVNAVGGTGQITDGNGTTINITAATATLTADEVVGETAIFLSESALETAISGTLTATASNIGGQVAIADTGSPTLIVDAGTGSAGSIYISVVGALNVATGGGNTVQYNENTENDSATLISTGILTVDNIIATTGNLSLTGDSVVDVSGGATLDNISAAGLFVATNTTTTLTSGTLTTLDITTTGAAAFTATDTNALVLADLDGDGAAVNAQGNIVVTSNGNLTINNAVTSTAAITLDASGNTTNNIDVNADISGGAAVTFANAVNLLIAGGSTISSTGGAIDAATSIGATGITLDGSGIISFQTLTADNAITLDNITSDGSATGQSLVVSSTDAANLGTIDLNGTTTNGDLTVAVDSNSGGVATLVVNNVSNVRDVTLSAGGAADGDTIDIDQNITAAGAINVSNAQTVLFNNAGNQTIDAQGGELNIVTGIGIIDLGGAATDLVTFSTTVADNAVNLGQVDGDGQDLTISSSEGVSLNAIDLNGEDLIVNIDTVSGSVVTLDVNNITNVGSVTFSGDGTNQNDIVDINQNITAGGSILIQDVASILIAADIDIEAQGGNVDLSDTSITSISLEGGAGTENIISSTTAAAGNDVLLSAIQGAGGNLTIRSEGTAVLSTIDLGDGTTNGDLEITIDADGGAIETLQITAAITDSKAITVQGVGNDDLIDINQSITATGQLQITTADNVDIAANLTLQGAGVDITGTGLDIDLSGASGSAVTIISTGNGNSVTLATTDSDDNSGLTLRSDDDLTISGVVNLGVGAFVATIDNNDDGANTLLVSAAPTAGAISLSGGGTGANDLIDINAAIMATSGALTLTNSTTVDVAAGLTLQGVSLAANSNIGVINLSGAGNNTFIATAGDLNIGPVTDSADAGLVATATGNTTISAIVLDDAASVNGNIAVTADSDNNTASQSLNVTGAVSTNNGTIMLSGGTDTNDTIDIDADVSAGGALTIQNAAVVDLAGGVNLQGAGVAASTAVTDILLSGADATTVTITSTGDGNTITTAAVTATNNPNLTLISDGNLTIGASLNIGTGTLAATVDNDNTSANTLSVSGSPTAGVITLSGGGTGSADTIDIDASITATTGALTLANANSVDIAAGLTLQGVSLAANSSIGTINLSGAGTNTFTATGGNANVGAITDSADASLTISATGDAAIAAVTLADGGTTNGNVLVTADSDNNSAASTLTVAGVVTTNNGNVTLGAGTDGDDTLDINNNVNAGGVLTIQNALVADLAAGLTLTGQSVAAATGIGTINLSGVGLNTITGTGGNVNIAAVTDSADASLAVSGTADVTLAGVVLDDAAAVNGTLVVNADSDNNTATATLAVNGVITTDGLVTLGGGTDNDDTLDLNASVTSAAALSLQNAATADLAANVNLTGLSVTANATNNLAAINLSGTGTNTISSTGGNVDVSAITDSGDASLVISASNNVVLAAITLDDAGTTNGSVAITADDNDDTVAASIMVNGVIAADGAVTLSGGTDLDDTIDINANITAGAALTVQNAVGVDLANAIALQGSSVAAAATVTVINLSGTSANTITSTSGDVSLAAITDSADAALTVGSAGNTTLAAITLDAGGASAVSVTTDDNDDTAAAVLTVAGAISSDGTVTLAGGADNDELIDINANITAANALTITNGNVDLAAGVVLQGSQVVANATGNVGTINLSGTGTNSIISTAQQVDIAAVTDSADASLIVSSADNVILAAITLDDAGTTNGTLTVTADDDDNATASLMATGAISSDGAISLAGGADNNDTIDLDASVVSGGAFSAVNATEIDLAAGVGITGASVTANATITAIDLSGAGTNTITSTGGNVDLAAIGDSADASLVVSSSANVTLASILLDDAGTTNGAITINADDNDDTATATLSASGTIIADGAISLAGGTDNDDTIDLDGDVTAGGTLVVQNASTLDLAVNVDIQGTSVTASSNITAINLSGAGTNIVTSTAGAVDLAAVVDAAAANLTINSEAGVMLAGIVLDAGGAGVLDINLDTDGDGTDNLDVNGDISVNSITVDGSGTGNETVSLAANVDLTATTGGIAMATANNIGGIDLDGAGTNIITTGGDSDITLAALTDSAAANLTIVSEGSVTLAGATFDAGGAGAITVTTDSDDDAGAETIQLDGVITTTGAVALAGTSADDTIDLNAGITSTGAGITLSTVNAIRAADITLDAQGGDLTLGAAVSLDGTTGATFTTTNVDSDITIAAITSTANQNATVNSTGAATLGGAINLGTGNLIVSVDSDDDTGVTETLAVNNTVNAGAVTLSAGIANSRSNITQTAVITATSLTASATNGIALTQDNVVPTVILNNVAAGNIQYRSDAGGTLTVNGANTVSAGEITITEVNNGITVATAGLAADAGVIALTTLAAGQLITLNGAVASNQSTATGANITLTADDMDLAGTGGSINAGTGGTVALVQVTAADAIDLGAANDATANSLDLSSAELNGITADRLLIGADTSGAITISADVNISNVATTHLKTGATVTGTAGGIVANDLAINASGTVNITDSTTNVNNLAVSAAGFDVTFVEADGFEVDLVDTADAVTGITGANITLTTGGNLGLVRGINASGNVINSAVGNITQDAGIGVVTTNGSINYVAASDDNASGAIIMAADSNIETDGAVGSNISLIAGTATGGGNITLANVDAGADGNVTIQTFGGSIRDDGRDSSVITGDNISLTAAVDIGGATAFTVDDAKSAALEITRNGLSGISSTASGGNNQLIVVDSSTFVAGDFLTGLAGSGMSAGTEKQIFIGVLDGELQVNSSIDLSGTPGANNDLFLFTGGENNNVLVDAAVKLNRDLNDPVLQRLLTFQSSGNVEQTNNAVRLEAFEVEASAPNGSVKLFTSTDQLQSTGGENDSIFLDNVTPDQTEFKDEDGNSTTQLLADIVTGGTGTITIINSGSLTINKKVETTGTGDISITVSSPLFVTESISSGGNVTLVSQGADAADGVFILGDGNTRNGSIQTKSISGLDASITITSENKVVLDGSAVLSTLASGSNGQINLTAGNGGLAGSGAGDVTMASGARITAAGGAEIAVTAVGTIQLGELDAGLTGNSNVSITSTAGGISDGNGTDENIIGNNVTLTASGTIDTDLIVAGDLTADSSAGNGDINITSTFGGLSLQTVNAGTGVTGGDVALIVEKGGITDANVADVTNITGAVVVLNANGSINSDVEASSRIAARVQDETGAAKDGAITLRTQGDFNVDALAANSGTVKVTAGGQITDANGAAANIVAGIADLTANGGGIDLEVDVSEVVKATAAMAGEISLANTSAGSSLNVGNITTSGAVSLTSLGAISSTGGIISGTDLSLTAAGNIGSGRSFLGTDVNTVTATTTAGGTWINEADALTVTSINNTGITAITAGGDLTVTELTSTAAVGLVSAGTLTVTELATTGPVNMQAGGDLTVLDLTSTAAVGLVSAGSLTVTELETTGSVDIEAGDELTIGSINADGTVDIDAEGNVVVDQLVTTADVTLATPGSLSFMGTQAGAGSAVGIDTTGSVKLALGGDLIDGNTSGVATIAANTLSVSGGNNVGVASALVTEVSNIDLDVAEVNIMNTGDMVFNDSSIGGNLTLINTGSLALANLNVAGQAVSIVASAEVTDANGQLTNITAQSLDITAASVQDIETSISELTADIAFLSVANTGSLTISDSSATGAFDVINDGVLTAAGIDAASVSITSTGDILARNISASGSVLLSTAANIIDDNGAAVNITADSLVVTGRADINGLDTAVSNLSLRTGDADLTNTLALTLLDSSVTGDLKLSNSNQLTIQNIFVTGDASLSTLADNLVLGDLQIVGTLGLDSAANILDGNGARVNITAVLGAALAANGSIGTFADAIEVNAGDLSITRAGIDSVGVSANFAGNVNGGLVISSNIPGFVVFDPLGKGFRPVGGRAYNELAAALGAEQQMFEGGTGFNGLFQFERIVDSYYPTDNADMEIRYGDDVETQLIEIEDILTLPLSLLDFDLWIEAKTLKTASIMPIIDNNGV